MAKPPKPVKPPPKATPPGPGTPMAFKDYATLTLATFAFLVSATTFYFTVIRVADKLSVVLINVPSLRVIDNTLVVGGTLSAVFINSGTRTATVTRIEAVFVNPSDAPKGVDNDNCKGTDMQLWGIDPVVVKEKDSTPIKAAIQNIPIPTRIPNEGVARLCLVFYVATPSQTEVPKEMDIGGFDLAKHRSPARRLSFTPIVLHQRRGTVFDD